MLTFAAGLMVVFNLATPYGGLIGLPITFFLKNKLHLAAHQLAGFNLWVGLPLYLSFVFGLVRDRWSPLGRGDRGHLVGFGAAAAALYLAMAFVQPTYSLLFVGLFALTCAVQVLAATANGLVSTVGQQHLMSGQVSAVFSLATWAPVTVATALGGALSQGLERLGPASAARLLFLVGAALMGAVAALGAAGPSRLFEGSHAERSLGEDLAGDVRRLARHAPIYAPLLLLLIWNFGPANGIALQYHLANTLKSSDATVGAWYAIFYGASLPPYALYGWLCTRVRLNRLLFWGTIVAVPQMLPMLFIHSATSALWAAAVMGLSGGLASAAYVDLAIRSCPRGLQGTMMMLVTTVFWVSGRFGDVLGTWLYDREGGFTTAIVVTTAVYALMLPTLLLAPRRLTAAADGEAFEEPVAASGHLLLTPVPTDGETAAAE
ncbi:MAG TPA: hypothetical protein VGS12_10325 [Caulobacteraceae bacterium]|nr:hypothetical protein [Caulobacteraceae bacterium]